MDTLRYKLYKHVVRKLLLLVIVLYTHTLDTLRVYII